MATETERKFLVDGDGWQANIDTTVEIVQGYFDVRDDTTVRIRLIDTMAGDDRRAKLTIKGPPDGWRRLEFEYDIPPKDASDMLDAFCADRTVQKHRHHVDWQQQRWTVDEFDGDLDGLTLAEIELHDDQPVDQLRDAILPPWVGDEVSEDRHYTNAHLARHGRPG